MDSKKLRKQFLEFFEKKGHKIVPSSSLLPTDQSVLFTTAGMQQFKPYYLGKESPYGKNVASCQKCIRTSDIEEVGDERHLTFFEMLGNFSFGGYFKEEAIKLAYDFIVKELGLKIDYVTVFSPEKVIEGDWRKGVPEDKESFEIWKNLGIRENKIRKEGADNFWGPTGEEGPCGPTAEIYVGGIEIWNIVFNQYYCDKNRGLKNLEIPGIDTGMGLERLAMVTQKKETVFETDLFGSVIEEIENISGLKYENNQRLFRILADHIKAGVFLASEGVLPSNIEQGYILRRLIRRAIRYGNILKMSDSFISLMAEKIIEIYKNIYPELENNKNNIFNIIKIEAEKFKNTLEKGLKEFRLQIENYKTQKIIPGKIVFDLYQSYGFPLELTKELAKEEGFDVEEKIFIEEFKKHQKISRAGAEAKFKGGLADHSKMTTKYHTATHLLLAALRQVLGDNVFQKGSNITAERLRLDFSYPEKMTAEQVKKVEDIVNEKIKEDLEVKFEEISVEKARKEGAMGVFGEKYGDVVKVYTIFDEKTSQVFSKEICGGPHVDKTSELGRFRIMKEESSSAGIRRIKAILESN